MPGAGSIKAAMYVHGVAPRDGSVIATIGRSAPLEPLLGDAQFDGRSFTWLGSIASNSSLCASWHATPIRTWQDALTKPFAQGDGRRVGAILMDLGRGNSLNIVGIQAEFGQG